MLLLITIRRAAREETSFFVSSPLLLILIKSFSSWSEFKSKVTTRGIIIPIIYVWSMLHHESDLIWFTQFILREEEEFRNTAFDHSSPLSDWLPVFLSSSSWCSTSSFYGFEWMPRFHSFNLLLDLFWLHFLFASWSGATLSSHHATWVERHNREKLTPGKNKE